MIDDDRILSTLNSYWRKKNINDPKLYDIKKLLSTICLDLPTVLKCIQLNDDRNTATHIIDKEKYDDKKYITKILTDYKNKIDKLHTKNALFKYKSEILKLINALLV